MNYDLLVLKVKDYFTSNNVIKNRYYHSLGVVDAAIYINKLYDLKIDEDKLKTAAILHDIAKYVSFDDSINILKENDSFLSIEDCLKSPQVLHSFVGKYIAESKFNIDDEEILNAIYFHTTGHPNMTALEEVIFVADYIEDGRCGYVFDNVRKALESSIHYAAFLILKQTINYLNETNSFIFPLTIDTFNYYKKEYNYE